MKKLYRSLMSVVLVAGISACSNSSKGESPNKANAAQVVAVPKPQPEPQASKSTEPQFDYNSLLTEETGSCPTHDLNVSSLDTDSVGISLTKDNKEIMADVEIILRSNQTYELQYKESDAEKFIPNGFEYARERTRNLMGVWEVKDNILYLGDLAVIQGTKLGENSVLNIKFSKDILSPGFKDRYMALNQARSESAIYSYRLYCPTPIISLGNFSEFAARQSVYDKKLKSLKSTKLFTVGHYLITDLEIIVQKDGPYYIVANVLDLHDPSLPEKAYRVGNGYWEMNEFGLNMIGAGVISQDAFGNCLGIHYTENLFIKTSEGLIEFPAQDSTAPLSFGDSSFVMDDLTSGLLGGAVFYNK